MKECGDCTLCCLLLPIKDANSKPNELCSHCDLKKGCKIYEKRPQACKDFNCSWLLDDNMSGDLRPDKCNVIFEKITNNIELALVSFEELNAWKRLEVIEHMRNLKKKGISTIISSFTNEPKRFMLADEKTEKEVWNDAMKSIKEKYK